jgi:hypothetical protein
VTQLVSVAIGLVSVYIFLALIVSHVSEWISALLNQRGKLLERAIVALVAGREAAADVAGTKVAAPTRSGTAAADPRDPRALVQYLYQHPLIGNLGTDGGRLPSYMPSRTFTLSLVAAIETFTADNPPPAASAPFTQGTADWNALRTAVADLPAGTLRQSLTTLLDHTQADYTSALGAIDAWFDAQMDRIAGTYKRWATQVMIALALLTVVLFNADTIGIANQLIHSATIATALSNSAQTAQGADIGTLVADLAQANLTLGWWAPPFGSPAIFFAKLGGLLITTAAVLLGAPFWFDVLKQIVPLRMAGPKPIRVPSGTEGDVQAKPEPTPP